MPPREPIVVPSAAPADGDGAGSPPDVEE
jgi:hypothetical protein